MTNDPILAAFNALTTSRPSDILMDCTRRRATIGDIDRLAGQLCLRIQESGVRRGNIVGLSAPNGPAFAAGYLGIRRAGLRVLLLDQLTPKPERNRIECSLGCAGMVVSNTGWPSSVEEIQMTLNPRTTPPSLADEISTIKLTSGSTGLPRGIITTSEALLNDDAAIRSSMGLKNECALAGIPLSHSYGFASLFLPSLTQGWRLMIPDGISPFSAIEAACKGQITFLPTVPAYIEALLKMKSAPPLPETLRRIITAGAPLRPEAARRFSEIFGHKIHVFYGASEVGGICYDRVGTSAEQGTLGSPIDGVTVLLNAKPNSLPGQGIVEIRSPAAAVGYFPRENGDLGGGRFLTSDIGCFLGDELQLLGRADRIVNVRGKKVDPSEIESVLNTVDGIEETVVMGLRSDPYSQEFLGAVVAGGQTMPEIDEILAWCRLHLAPHKVPRRVLRVNSLPRNPRGKLDRDLIRQLFEKR